MKVDYWRSLGWEHPVWELVRYFLSLGGAKRQAAFVTALDIQGVVKVGEVSLPLETELTKTLLAYLTERAHFWRNLSELLRTEEEASRFCVETFGETLATTRTKNKDHHQSPKALVLTATRFAEAACKEFGYTIDSNPQTRCVWLVDHDLHVSARNLDGAIPALFRPILIWEIKEYWGQTKGGSKMSDAVYECALVGRELRDFERRTASRVGHAVLLDGRGQWTARKSDLLRFCDLYCQGLIDKLLIGREIETDWQPYVRSTIESALRLQPSTTASPVH